MLISLERKQTPVNTSTEREEKDVQGPVSHIANKVLMLCRRHDGDDAACCCRTTEESLTLETSPRDKGRKENAERLTEDSKRER